MLQPTYFEVIKNENNKPHSLRTSVDYLHESVDFEQQHSKANSCLQKQQSKIPSPIFKRGSPKSKKKQQELLFRSVNRFNQNQVFSFYFPFRWVKQREICELFELNSDEEEYKIIEQKIKQSSSTCNIVSIKRIQNQHLWRKYYFEREIIASKNGSSFINEKQLFHGSNNDPLSIYNGEEGFDMRYAHYGLWGEGMYFTEKFSTTNDYAYCDSKKIKHVFLSRVIVGHSCDLTDKYDNLLKKPPKKPNTHPNQSNIPFSVDYYDSVFGDYKSDFVYTIYSNSKAYPEYIISYSELDDE